MMPPQLSEDEVDDMLYYARTGDIPELKTLSDQLCTRENIPLITLLSSTTDPHTGNGPLHMAAANGHTEILRVLITTVLTQSSPQASNSTATTTTTHTSLLNAQNTSGNTPLHYAALNGHLECVKLLLDNGADPTIVNSAGHDAVYEAELGDRTEVVEWVLREGGEGLESGVGGGGGEGEEEDVEGREESVDVGERGDGGGEGGGGGAGSGGGGVSGAEERIIREGMSGLSVKEGEEDHL